MPKARTAAEFLGTSAEETEAAFYQALQAADIELLMACWSDDEDVVLSLIHISEPTRPY